MPSIEIQGGEAMKQCPTCGQLMWLEDDGKWKCANCNTTICLICGDTIYRYCTKCAKPHRLEFRQRVETGYLFGCPSCDFTMAFS